MDVFAKRSIVRYLTLAVFVFIAMRVAQMNVSAVAFGLAAFGVCFVGWMLCSKLETTERRLDMAEALIEEVDEAFAGVRDCAERTDRRVVAMANAGIEFCEHDERVVRVRDCPVHGSPKEEVLESGSCVWSMVLRDGDWWLTLREGGMRRLLWEARVSQWCAFAERRQAVLAILKAGAVTERE